MREFAKDFYASLAWKKTRAYIYKRDAGLCVRCLQPGEIVHHKKHLTSKNINNPLISLHESNLELLCRDCHALEHVTKADIAEGLKFDDEGNVIIIGKV